LAVIHFPVLNPVDHGPGLVAVHADVEQDGGIVPVDELGRHHAGVGAERLLHHVVDHVGVERTVVVAEEEEGSALDHSQRLVTGRRIPRSSRQQAHERLGKDPAHPHRRVGFVVRDQDQDRELFVALGGQRRQRLVEPRTPPCGHDDRHNCWHLGVH
jgi:hypothetical protein